MSNEIMIRRVDDRFQAKIPYADGDGPHYAKRILGYRWEKDDRCWSYPLNWPNCLALRTEVAQPLNAKIVFSEGMLSWAKEEKSRRTTNQLRSETSEVIQLPRLQKEAPNIWSAMEKRPFQTHGVHFVTTREGSLLADDPGLGKTVQTLASVVEAGVTRPILVIANKSAAEITWPNEIKKWLPGDRIVRFGTQVPKDKRGPLIDDEFEFSEMNGGRTWVIMNPHWIRAKAEIDAYGKFVYDKGHKIVQANVPELFGHKWGAVVVDESQETLACNTGNAKKWSQQRQGLGLLQVETMKLSLSGTPMRGKPENLFGQLQWLNPQQYTSYWNWAKRHFNVTNDGYKDAMQVGELLSEERFYEEAAEVMIRRDKSTVAADLPPKQYAGTALEGGDVYGIWLPMEKKQKKMYDDFVANQVITDEDGSQLDAIGALAVYTRLKQLATTSGSVGTRQVKIPAIYDEEVIDSETGALIHNAGDVMKDDNGRIVYLKNPETGEFLLMDEQYLIPEMPSNKYDWLCEWLEERGHMDGSGKGKVIIASQFRQVIDMFREALGANGVPSFAITGATSAKERVKQQDEFQNNPDSPKLFFLQSKAGGTSLTLDMADDVILLDEMWDPDVQTQIEDRAHRLSRAHNVTIWYLRTLGTVEEFIGTTVEERNRVCRAVMDGSRGVSVKKKLLGKES